MDGALACMREAWRSLAPAQRLTVDQWADRYRILDRFTSAEHGRWKTERTPYLRQPMRDFTDPTVEEIVLVAGTQVGKTEAILNMIGFVADQDPGPTMAVLPREEDAKNWGQKRARRALENSPRLALHLTGKEDDVQGKLFKLDRMYLKLAGANSPADLVSDPCRYVFFDEVDKYPKFSGKDASPLKLGRKRTTTFWNRKIVEASTPTLEEAAIWQSFLSSLVQRYFVPCLRCGGFQAMGFRKRDPKRRGMGEWSKARASSIVWPKNIRAADLESGDVPVWMQCAQCGGRMEEAEKEQMVGAGVWCPEGCDVIDGRVVGKVERRARRGYHIPAMLSPWVSWAELVGEFLGAKDEPDGLMSFVNNSLAEPWQDVAIEKVDAHPLMQRREVYGVTVPEGVLFLTCGVDVQADRIEYEVFGWGVDYESWSIEYEVLWGNTLEREVWKKLDERLKKRWDNADGVGFGIVRAFIDSSFNTAIVYSFVRKRQVRQIFAVKGEDGSGRPIAVLSKGQVRSTGLHLWIVGIDSAKDWIFGALRLDEVGPSYQHFPMYDEDYFLMLTAERPSIKRVKGFQVRSYEKIRDRNETLDLRVYGYAAAYSMRPDWAGLAENVERKGVKVEQTKERAAIDVVDADALIAEVEAAGEAQQEADVVREPITDGSGGERAERQPFPSDVMRKTAGGRRPFVKGWR